MGDEGRRIRIETNRVHSSWIKIGRTRRRMSMLTGGRMRTLRRTARKTQMQIAKTEGSAEQDKALSYT